MSSKENLIRSFRGSIDGLESIEKELDNESLAMFDETGHVDCVFLTEVITLVSKLMETQERVMARTCRLLGCNDEPAVVRTKKGGGAKMSPESVLAACTFSDNTVYLPKVQLNKDTYREVNKRIEQAGGSWVGGKVQGFTFPFDATRVWNILKTGQKCNLQQDFQFFETPAETADWLVSLAGGIDAGDRVLEPSAGRGSIVSAIVRNCPGKSVDCYELMPENQEILSRIREANIVGNDFLQECWGEYDKIIANPPFSGNQDVRHVKRMYELLAVGGTLAAITSCHWETAAEKLCTEFRYWLESVSAQVYEIPGGTFADSGTSVKTIAIVITKKDNYEQ